MTSGRAKETGQMELRGAFFSAKSADERIKALKDMEASSCFQQNDLFVEYWKLTDQLYEEGRDPEEMLSFGKKALEILLYNFNSNMLSCFGEVDPDQSHTSCLFVSCTLNVLGYACFALKRYGESLAYLNWSNRNLGLLEAEENRTGTRCCDKKCVYRVWIGNQSVLYNLKVDMERGEEAVLHQIKILEIKEKSMEKDSIDIAKACEAVYGAYIAILKYKEALPFCFKAVQIYTKQLGEDSVEVAQIRREIGAVYNALGERDKALEHIQLAVTALKGLRPSEQYNQDETVGMLMKGVTSGEVPESHIQAVLAESLQYVVSEDKKVPSFSKLVREDDAKTGKEEGRNEELQQS